MVIKPNKLIFLCGFYRLKSSQRQIAFLLTNKNVALKYSVTLGAKKQQQQRIVHHHTVPNINVLTTLLFSNLTLTRDFHKLCPLVTIVKRMDILQFFLPVTVMLTH